MHSHHTSPGRRLAPLAGTGVAMALSLVLAALAPTAQAQQAKPADPTDPQAKVPPLGYQGSLSRYRTLPDAPGASWQALNEKANRAGGWRAYAREKLPPDDAPAAAAVSPVQKPAPAAKGHEGHAPR